MDNGPIVSWVIRQGNLQVIKAVNLRLRFEQNLFATFDPSTLNYRMAWEDDSNLSHNPLRHDGTRGT